MFESAMKCAIDLAKSFDGQTAPNPPVGAVLIDETGRILAEGAHEKAGLAHAEVQCLQRAKELGIETCGKTLVVTLEPCNHTGRTPPCTQAILAADISRLVYGSGDPNPKVQGAGGTFLKNHGIEVVAGVEVKKCDQLIEGFRSLMLKGRPFVTVKVALDEKGSMIPPQGQKTFTSEESLNLAHRLRKRSDAILTGSGTILADNPLFTVRRVPDFAGKRRWLFILDRRQRVSDDWIEGARLRGLDVIRASSVEEAFRVAGEKGCLRLLVEAGPLVTDLVRKSGLWDEWTEIHKGC